MKQRLCLYPLLTHSNECRVRFPPMKTPPPQCGLTSKFFVLLFALTLLVGRQEGHLACKNWVVRYWRGYLSGARCKMICIWSIWCHCHLISCCSKIQNGLPFWCQLTQVALEKRPLNGCSNSSMVYIKYFVSFTSARQLILWVVWLK